MRLSQMYPSKYLKAADLQGKEVKAMIVDVKYEELGRDKEQKPGLYFKGTERGLVMNKTNGMLIGDYYGDDTDDWIGKPVILYSTWVDFGGRSTQAIRIKVPEAGKKAAVQAAAAEAVAKDGAAVDDLDDEISF